MKYKTFIFDFDYTLVDATEGIVICVNHALEKAGLEQASIDNIRKTVGMTLQDMFSYLTGINDTAVADRFFSDFMQKADSIMTENTYLIDDTIAVLTMLKNAGYNIAIVTTKVRYRVNEILEKYSFSGLIDFIVGYEDVENVKPSPEGLLKAIDFFGNDKNSVLFISHEYRQYKRCGQ